MIWIDAQMSPDIAAWITANFQITCSAVRDLGLRDASDREIFLAARDRSAIIMTKDSDFIQLQAELGPPPQVIWVTCGNTSNLRLREILASTLPTALNLLSSGENLVELTGE